MGGGARAHPYKANGIDGHDGVARQPDKACKFILFDLGQPDYLGIGDRPEAVEILAPGDGPHPAVHRTAPVRADEEAVVFCTGSGNTALAHTTPHQGAPVRVYFMRAFVLAALAILMLLAPTALCAYFYGEGDSAHIQSPRRPPIYLSKSRILGTLCPIKL